MNYHMDNRITLYTQRLNLQRATFTRGEHDDAMVAVVYKIVPRNGNIIKYDLR